MSAVAVVAEKALIRKPRAVVAAVATLAFFAAVPNLLSQPAAVAVAVVMTLPVNQALLAAPVAVRAEQMEPMTARP